MNFSEMTKSELLEQAQTLNIKGRHKMSVDQLRAELAHELTVSVKGPSAEAVKAVKTRRPSTRPRDDEGRVIREGRNLSGNVPFREKFYYLDPKVASEEKWTPEYREAEAAAPMQVRLILKHMRMSRITREDASQTGRNIADGAIRRGVLKTKIAPANLFAYYRRVLETLGVIHAVDFGAEEEGEE